MQISRVYSIIQYPSVLIAGCPDGISKDLFMLAFMKPSAFRIGRGFFYLFFFPAISGRTTRAIILMLYRFFTVLGTVLVNLFLQLFLIE